MFLETSLKSGSPTSLMFPYIVKPLIDEGAVRIAYVRTIGIILIVL